MGAEGRESEKVKKSKRVRGGWEMVIVSTLYESADARPGGGAFTLPSGTRGRF